MKENKNFQNLLATLVFRISKTGGGESETLLESRYRVLLFFFLRRRSLTFPFDRQSTRGIPTDRQIAAVERMNDEGLVAQVNNTADTVARMKSSASSRIIPHSAVIITMLYLLQKVKQQTLHSGVIVKLALNIKGEEGGRGDGRYDTAEYRARD